jgi:hypothetical protein
MRENRTSKTLRNYRRSVGSLSNLLRQNPLIYVRRILGLRKWAKLRFLFGSYSFRDWQKWTMRPTGLRRSGCLSAGSPDPTFPVREAGLVLESACAVKAGAFQWEIDPPGNWFAPPGSNRSGGGGNKAVGAFDVKGRLSGSVSM